MAQTLGPKALGYVIQKFKTTKQTSFITKLLRLWTSWFLAYHTKLRLILGAGECGLWLLPRGFLFTLFCLLIFFFSPKSEMEMVPLATAAFLPDARNHRGIFSLLFCLMDESYIRGNLLPVPVLHHFFPFPPMLVFAPENSSFNVLLFFPLP